MNLSYELLAGSNFVKTQNFWGDSHMSHYIRFRPVNVDTNEIKQWCYATYGQEGLINTTMTIRWFDDLDNGAIRFRDEVDAMLFKLRWA